MTKDYTITLQDITGRIVVLHICGASVDEIGGDSSAKEIVEANAFQNAIEANQIGEDAWLVSYSE